MENPQWLLHLKGLRLDFRANEQMKAVLGERLI